MKKFFAMFVLLIWTLTACAPQAQPTEQPLLPNEDSYPQDSYPNGDSSSEVPANWTPAQQAAVTLLSQTLNLPPGQITLISTEAVEWPDGCLGIRKPGVMCTQAIVPGYRIILEANGVQYEVRTNEDGRVVASEPITADGPVVQDTLVTQLSTNLGIKPSAVSIVSVAETEFADACLGVAMQNVMCAQVLTPGQIIVLEANGRQYEYHVSADGSRIQPATLALTWSREGGIAGFCDSLTVFLSGEIYGNQCKSQPDGTMGTFTATLSAGERQQFETWVKELGQVNLDASDPEGVSDRMVVKVEFYGAGKGSLSQTNEQALLNWAQAVHQKLYR
jgi:hypothetical protein